MEVAQLLISKNAAVDQQDSGGMTALMHAAMRDHLPMVNFLLDSSASKEMYSVKGESATHLAIKSGHLDVVKVLSSGTTDHCAKRRKLNTPPEPTVLGAQPNQESSHLEADEFCHESEVEFFAPALSSGHPITNYIAPGVLSSYNPLPSIVNPQSCGSSLAFSQPLMNTQSLMSHLHPVPSTMLACSRARSRPSHKNLYEALLPISDDWKSLGVLLDCDCSTLQYFEKRKQND